MPARTSYEKGVCLSVRPSIRPSVYQTRDLWQNESCLPNIVFHFWPKLNHPAARSLCDSWATCNTKPMLIMKPLNAD